MSTGRRGAAPLTAMPACPPTPRYRAIALRRVGTTLGTWRRILGSEEMSEDTLAAIRGILYGVLVSIGLWGTTFLALLLF